MDGERLAQLISKAIVSERDRARLTQQQLADRSGLPQSAIARIERGRRPASLAVAERLMAAMDKQFLVHVEPLDAHLDARIVAQEQDIAAEGPGALLRGNDIQWVREALGELPFLFDGASAARLQGVPVPSRTVFLAVAHADMTAFAGWLKAKFARRWNPRWEEFGYLDPDPHVAGEAYWRMPIGDVRARYYEALPTPVTVLIDGWEFRAVPVATLLADPDIDDSLARIIARARDRAASGPAGA